MDIGKELLSAILDSTYNAIVAIDIFGTVVAFNQAAEKIVGLPAHEALSRHIKEIIPNTGLLEVLKSGKIEANRRLVIYGRTVISNRSPIFSGSEIVGAVGVFQDLSDIENLSQELDANRKLNAELQAIIESSNDGIYITDGMGSTVRANSAYERITGIRASEVIGRHMADLVKEGYISESVTLRVLENRVSKTILQRIRNGKVVIVTGNPVFNDQGEITMVVTNVRDITELNALQEKLQETSGLSRGYQQALTNLMIPEDESLVVGISRTMKELQELIRQIAPFPTTVLIEGESGVGKEILAGLIHRNSNRAEEPFIKVNCGAIPDHLLESELFGYEAGAFTGAQRQGKPGLFELADGGTLLLDEIGELPHGLQVKLLRVLQEKEILRVGGLKPKRIDVRVLSTTNRKLEEAVKKGDFRSDLFYRLNVVRLVVPPLRERREDVPVLVNFFFRKFCQEYGLRLEITSDALACLEWYDWPGNVRELKNLIENLVVSSRTEIIGLENLPAHMHNRSGGVPQRKVVVKNLCKLQEAVSEMESQLLEMAIKEYPSLRKAAAALGINHATLLRKARRLAKEKSQQN